MYRRIDDSCYPRDLSLELTRPFRSVNLAMLTRCIFIPFLVCTLMETPLTLSLSLSHPLFLCSCHRANLLKTAVCSRHCANAYSFVFDVKFHKYEVILERERFVRQLYEFTLIILLVSTLSFFRSFLENLFARKTFRTSGKVVNSSHLFPTRTL